MKNIVGKITVTKRFSRTGVYVYMCGDLAKLFDDEIIFNLWNMTLKRPTIDSLHTYSIKAKQFSLPLNNDLIDDFLGDYKVIQKDEDTFVMKKYKHHGPHDKFC